MDILDEFIVQAEENVESGYYDIGITPATKVSLKEKLLSREFGLIAEIKHASPAGEYSFEHINVAKTAQLFRAAGADAISVVVEPKIFRGSLANVPVAKSVGLPVLFKDFVFNARQIEAARACGADCILLIVKVADRLSLDLDGLVEKSHSLGLEVLLECYDAEEMRRAAKTDADIIGINNRDLATLKVDLNRTKEIMEEAGPGKPVVSESGVRSGKDAEFLKSCGARGILVGTALWKAENQAEKIRELRL